METTFAKRLINARKMRDLSQRGLCNAMQGKVSPTAIAKYEKGDMLPSSEVLISISQALNVDIDYFFRPFVLQIDRNGFEFRKQANLGKKKTDSLREVICDRIERIVEVESLLDLKAEFSLDYSDFLIESDGDAVTAAQRFRSDMNIGNDAIVSAVELLESMGIEIMEIDAAKSFSGTCTKTNNLGVIVINASHSVERKRFTMFHELGHLLLHVAEGADVERICNIFANEVLIPSEQLKRMIGNSRHDISLVELKAIQSEYGISVDALMWKASQLNIITQRRYVYFCKKKNAAPNFKHNVEESLYMEKPSSRFERLVYRALASDVISYSKAASLLNIPIENIRQSIALV